MNSRRENEQGPGRQHRILPVRTDTLRRTLGAFLIKFCLWRVGQIYTSLSDTVVEDTASVQSVKTVPLPRHDRAGPSSTHRDLGPASGEPGPGRALHSSAGRRRPRPARGPVLPVRSWHKAKAVSRPIWSGRHGFNSCHPQHEACFVLSTKQYACLY
jgi:hypothetical protein